VYASGVYRRFPLFALLLLVGCRVTPIPKQPSAQEYTVYSAWIEQASAPLPHTLAVAVDSSTLIPQQRELQFEQCLPRRMAGIFDSAPETVLTSTSSNDWLRLSDGRSARLLPHNALPTPGQPTELFRFSRVAFTRMGYQAFFWVEHHSCSVNAPCEGESGALVHGWKSGGTWSFEDTLCQTLSPLP